MTEVESGSVLQKAVRIPAQRMTAIRKYWMDIYTPIVKHCKLELRMNVKKSQIELRVGPETTEIAVLAKAAEFIRCVVLGFLPADALAILRMDDIYVHTFDCKQVRLIKGDHLGRAVGRISGSHGRTKHALENTTRTRIVIQDTVVHIMGTVENVKICRNAITDLIRGSPAGKVATKYKTIVDRLAAAS